MAFFLRFLFLSTFIFRSSVLLGAEQAIDSELCSAGCTGTGVAPVRQTTSPTSSPSSLVLDGLSLTILSLEDLAFISRPIPVAFARRDKADNNTVPSVENCVSAMTVENALENNVSMLLRF